MSEIAPFTSTICVRKMVGQGSAMNTVEFRCLVTREFPQLQEEFDCWEDDLPHLQMAEFLKFTQEAIEARSFGVARKSFEIATTALKSGEDALLNAIYVSFLEHLDFRSDAGKEALLLMPAELKKGRYDILAYDEKLLGRKLAADDRT
jgi:hypothetical protein